MDDQRYPMRIRQTDGSCTDTDTGETLTCWSLEWPVPSELVSSLAADVRLRLHGGVFCLADVDVQIIG